MTTLDRRDALEARLHAAEADASVHPPINSDRYDFSHPTGVVVPIGRGAWGGVYWATDTLTGKKVAIKTFEPSPLAQKQMEERNLTPEKVMLAEATGFSPSSGVLTRHLEKDDDGNMYIVMPWCKRSLHDIIRDGENDTEYRQKVQSDSSSTMMRVTYGELLDHVHNIASAVGSMHKELGRAHGDLSAKNIMETDTGRYVLTDLGTSDIDGYGATVSPRERVGNQNIRAPELWQEGERPTSQSDLFSLAALNYRLYTGKYPIEVVDYSDAAQAGDKEQLEDIFLGLRKDIPRKVRFIVDGLTTKYRKQADEVTFKIDRMRHKRTAWDEVANGFKQSLWGTVPIAVMTAGIITYSVAEGNHDAPLPRLVSGPLTLEANQLGEYEPSQDYIPTQVNAMRGTREAAEEMSRAASEYTDIAYLTQHAWIGMHSARFGPVVTEYQADVWNQGNPDEHRRYANGRFQGNRGFDEVDAIAYSLENSVRELQINGPIDIEDLMVHSRYGQQTLDILQEWSGSQDFSQYIYAQNPRGDYVLDENERNYLIHWRASMSQ